MLETSLTIARIVVEEFLTKDSHDIELALLYRELSSQSEPPFQPNKVPGAYFAGGIVTGSGFMTKFKQTPCNVVLWQAHFETQYHDVEKRILVQVNWSDYLLEVQGPTEARFYEHHELARAFERISERHRSTYRPQFQ